VRLLVKERDIPHPVDPRITIFMTCQAMDFKHLPMPGGLFAQNPGLLEAFQYIWQEQSKAEAAKKKAEQNAKMGPQSRRPRRRR